MPTLTKKQSEVLAFIREWLATNDYAPSVREIADGLGMSSPSTVHQHLEALKSKGYLEGEDGTARSLRVVEEVESASYGSRLLNQVIQLPLMGLITAGAPIEAVENKEVMAVPADFGVDGVNSYVLKVKGQSMIEDGILDGDFVIVERNNSPQNGDIVVALLDNAYATLKRFYREATRIRLQPANSTMNPIYVRDLIVQGVVRGVIRKYI